MTTADTPPTARLILTPDQRLRVFVSSTLGELAIERGSVRDGIAHLRLAPVMFELGARPHPPRKLYRAYLAQSHVFVGIYWQSYGWVAPDEKTSGLEDEYLLSGILPKLIYVKSPAPDREPRLAAMLAHIREDDRVSYKAFSTPTELRSLVENDLALLLTEHFQTASVQQSVPERASQIGQGTLPTPPTPLVGREQEIEAVTALLHRTGVRLVTLTGPGGIGKSRLALAVGAKLGSSFENGVRFVALAAITDPELVASRVAKALGLLESGSQPPLEDLKSYLHNKRLLLILDNFEQVTAASPLIAELLGAAPGIQVIVTSRTMLRLSGEYVFTVPPLSLPEPEAEPEVESLGQYEAVRLFVERAQAANPDFALKQENARDVTEICRRLDGLPLVIELAAARVRLLSPQALLTRLESSLGFLTGGARDLPERQQTLRNTIAWSYDLLGKDEQALFAQLGVFSGGFDLQAVETICCLDGGSSAESNQVLTSIEALSSLLDHSLVRQEGRDGEPRFGMLETIREYALERLQSSAVWQATCDRHADYYLVLAEAAEPELKSPNQLAWLERLETENDNLRAALTRFLSQDQIALAARLGWGLWMFWWLKRHINEGVRWFEEMLTKSGSLPPYPRARVLSGLAMQVEVRGDEDRAKVLFEQSLPLYREVGDKPGIAKATGMLGRLAMLRGDYAAAETLLEESLTLYRELGDNWFLAIMLNFRGMIPLGQSDRSQAAHFFGEALRVSRIVNDTLPLLLSLYNLALSKRTEGKLTEATALVEEGLVLSDKAGDEASLGYYLEELAALAQQLGDFERAERLYGAADTLLEKVGSVWLYTYASNRSQHAIAVDEVHSTVETALDEVRAQGRDIGRARVMDYALRKGEEMHAQPPGPAPDGK
ncbi:tetratricopeptide repeat protein [Synechocystis sp. PCC 7509]|uniref:tetratricopeptide repeat protein n=1 Tax=Synechocystis sp. PCC 7509 TaxID=927677 RepID=UPI00130E777A|nr:tetratricopeptide repeat protein [Synechocystis sp. PCC 7509]